MTVSGRHCERCASRSRVIESGRSEEVMERYRECFKCGFRWHTVEITTREYDLLTEDERVTGPSEGPRPPRP